MAQKFITSLEITDTHVKVIKAKGGRGQNEITACDVRRIDPPSEDGCLKVLTALVAEHQLKAQPVVLVLPRRLLILRHLTLPSLDAQEISKMVNLQLADKVPYSREDIVYDHAVISKEENGYSKVLVVLAHRDVVKRYLQMATKAGLNPTRIMVSSSGLAAWWAQRRKEQELRSSVSTLINIDEVDAEICFCLNGQFLFSRQIQLGARDLNVEHVDQFMHQVDLTLRSYTKDKMGPAPENFVLISTLAEANVLKERLQADLKKDVELCSPLDEFPELFKKSDKMSVWERSGYSAAVGIGAVLGDPQKSFNLMPSEIKDSKAVNAGRQRWLKMAVLCGSIMVLIACILGVDIYHRQENIDQLQAKVKALKSDVVKAEAVIKLVDYTDDHILKRVMVTDILAELYRLTPGDISFRSLVINASGAVTLQGYSRSRTSVNAFQNQLVNSQVFKNVTLQYASRSRMTGAELTDFKMTFDMPLPGGDQP